MSDLIEEHKRVKKIMNEIIGLFHELDTTEIDTQEGYETMCNIKEDLFCAINDYYGYQYTEIESIKEANIPDDIVSLTVQLARLAFENRLQNS